MLYEVLYDLNVKVIQPLKKCVRMCSVCNAPPVMNANTYDIAYSGFPYVNLFEAAPYNINTVHQTFIFYFCFPHIEIAID